MELQNLLDKGKEYLPPERLPLITAAYEFAAQAHDGQRRKSGEPYVQHPLHTAVILADIQMDAAALAAALLHDVLENCGVPLSEIEAKFGPEIAKLVDGVTKLSKISWPGRGDGSRSKRRVEDSESQAENLRKMLVAMAEDIRVVLIKLADRLHNMRTLAAMPPPKRLQVAQETMDIYAPLASRLGIWQLKWELEDLSFRYLQPDEYRQIARLIASRRVTREKHVQQVVQILKEEFEQAGFKAEVSGRPKHIYSIYNKMNKYEAVGKDFDQIYDLLAVRVLVNEVQDCYNALGLIHNLWHPIFGQFNDYIANPKESMYQSLHTTVLGPGAKPLEIQIRTYDMHRVAEYGIAAHWRYKEGARKDLKFEAKIAWLRQLMEWQRDVSGAQEFVEWVKTDIFRDQVFVYTPKGEIKDLPAGSTPLDFAYRIHTDLGHRCIGAKVGGRLVPLDYQLQNGDVVEILATKTERGPSRDWLTPNLGYIKTSHAREKIRQWFKKQEKAENVERGREILEKELRRLGIDFKEQEEIAKLYKYDRVDDFLAAIGVGEVSVHQIALKLAAPEEVAPSLPPTPELETMVATSVQVLGVGDLLSRLAQCCHPVPGDEIVGYITRSRGVTVHRADCPNVLHEDEKERLVKVDWGRQTRLYPVGVRIEAWDRVGLLRDISTIVSEERVNMSAVNIVTQTDQTAIMQVVLETTGIDQLSRLLANLEKVKGITRVERSMDGRRPATT